MSDKLRILCASVFALILVTSGFALSAYAESNLGDSGMGWIPPGKDP